MKMLECKKTCDAVMLKNGYQHAISLTVKLSEFDQLTCSIHVKMGDSKFVFHSNTWREAYNEFAYEFGGDRSRGDLEGIGE